MNLFYDSTIKVKRLKGAGNIKTMVATATAEASIQPLGKDRAQIDTGLFGTTHSCFVDITVPAQKGDMVVDQNQTVYTIEEVNIREYGAFPYKELIIKKSK